MSNKLTKLLSSLCLNLLSLLLFLTLGANTISADENFDQTQEIEYHFKDDFTVEVINKLELTNKITNLYISEYEIVLNHEILGTPKGFDSQGAVTIETQKTTDDKTHIKTVLNDKVVGIGNKTHFTISYYLNGLVDRVGRIKEIYIPTINSPQGSQVTSIKVFIPKNYGPLAYTKPQTKYKASQNLYSIELTAENNPIIIGFGDYAHFNFNLTYQLKNTSLLNRKVEIALPPDTGYQKITLESVSKRPENVIIDEDGNWLAQYILGPSQKLTITAVGSAQIYANPQADFKDKFPSESHTRPARYWEITNDTVKQNLKDLTSAQDIYNYLVTNFGYNHERINKNITRKGAQEALLTPKDSLCMEFTDTFIALSRINNIPTREVSGFAHTDDETTRPLTLTGDILHAWPQYWDSNSQSWISIDPTWGNTTAGADYFNSLDFNHFELVRRGVSSIYPHEAGSFRIDENAKLVDVTITDKDFPNTPVNISTKVEGPKNLYQGDQQKLLVSVENNSQQAVYNIPIIVSSWDLTLSPTDQTITLPPFGKKDVAFLLKAGNNNKNGKYTISVLVNGVSYPFETTVLNKYYKYLYSIILILIAAVLYFIKRKHYVKPDPKKNTPNNRNLQIPK